MPNRPKYRLKLKRLDFVSMVDRPAQETATAVLLKRDGAMDVNLVAPVVKTSDELGLVFCWAVTSKVDGQEYWDLQGDNVEEDTLVKVAADFMENSRAADEMHDENTTGSVVFAMPWTPEVAKAFLGDEFDAQTTGLMVALKPPADAFEKFKSGEYTGVSIAGTGERALAKRMTISGVWLTSSVDGHAHLLKAADVASGQTSWIAVSGTDQGHQHDWVVEGGQVRIADAAGHGHELVPDGTIFETLKSHNAGLSSERATAMADDTKSAGQLETELAKAQAKMAELRVLAGLTDAEKRHLNGLAEADQPAFLAKNADDRASDISKAAESDPVVYTTASGDEIRKSAGTAMVNMAKRLDAAEKAQAEAIAKAHDVEISKAAEGLSHLPGDAGTHRELVRAVKGIQDDETRAKVEACLKGQAVAMSAGTAQVGSSATPTKVGKMAEYETALSDIQTEKGLSKAEALKELRRTNLALCRAAASEGAN